MKNDRNKIFAYIETKLFWGQGLTAFELGKEFKIARQNAQNIISEYRKLYPGNIYYDNQKKRQVAGTAFTAKYISTKPEAYLDYVRGMNAAAYYWNNNDYNEVLFEDVNSQLHPVLNKNIIRLVLSAIQAEKSLYINYQSKYSIQPRNISPHHLVYANNRYHVRAYCHTLNVYLDFALSRIIDAELSTFDWISGEEDYHWNTWTIYSVQVNPKLPSHVQRTLIIDYQLGKDLIRKIKSRKATQIYLKKEIQKQKWDNKCLYWIDIKKG